MKSYVTKEQKLLSATPSNPSSGFGKTYLKDDGKLYTLNSAGTEVEVGGGGDGNTNAYSVIVNEDVTIGDGICYVESDGYYKTDLLDDTKHNYIGVATESVTVGNNCILNCDGIDSNQTGLTTGDDVFLSVNTNAYKIDNVTTLSYKDLDDDNGTSDVSFSSDGLKIFTTEYYRDGLQEYHLTTPWDITTAGPMVNNGHLCDSPRGGCFGNNGIYYYVSDINGNKISQFTMTTAWDTTTMTHTRDWLTGGIDPVNLDISSDGTKMYFSEYNIEIKQYSMSTPYDISTLSLVNTFDFTSITTYAYNVRLNNDGSKIFYTNNNVSLIELTMSTPYDITTCSHTGTHTGIDSAYFCFGDNGTKIFFAIWSESSVQSYNCVSYSGTGILSNNKIPGEKEIIVGKAISSTDFLIGSIHNEFHSPNSFSNNVTYTALTSGIVTGYWNNSSSGSQSYITGYRNGVIFAISGYAKYAGVSFPVQKGDTYKVVRSLNEGTNYYNFTPLY